MPDSASAFLRPPLQLAWAISLALHAAILFVPRHAPPSAEGRRAVMQAHLPAAEPVEVPPVIAPGSRQKARSGKPVLAVAKDKGKVAARSVPPSWTAAEKSEMNRFLDELGPAKAAPSLAQRSLAMAQQVAREQPRDGDGIGEVVERLPNSPPIDPFGLEMYMDGLVKKLNRSAAFVRNDPRTKGLRVASVLVRLNPDGSLNNFRILNAADQQDEVDFIRRVVEQAVPFSAFPGDIRRSAKTLSLLICIQPPRAGSGFGFTRHAEGRGC